MTIAFNSVKIKAKTYKKEILKKVSDVIDSGRFLNGPENETLIKNLKKYLGAGRVITTASGHSSILIALRALHLQPEDEVIFPVNVHPTAFAIAQSGATLVPVDVTPLGLIDPQEIIKKITNRTRAIVLVHLYGLVADLDEIKKIIKGKKIILIEDCAQAFGSRYKNKPVGIYGDISCYSFYPTKNLSTLGNGGALWCHDPKLFDYFKKAISYGAISKYNSEFIAGHSRLAEIQAGIINIYIKDFKSEQAAQKKVLECYQELFKKYYLNSSTKLLLQYEKHANPYVHLLVVETKNRDALGKFLQKRGIEYHIHYPQPIHLIPAFSYLNYKKGYFPRAEYLSEHILSLPFHPYLSQKEIEFIVKSIKDFYA